MNDAECYFRKARNSFRRIAGANDAQDIERYAAEGRELLWRAHKAAKVQVRTCGPRSVALRLLSLAGTATLVARTSGDGLGWS
jgi:hypothetical protein